MISSYMHRPLHLFNKVAAHLPPDKNKEIQDMRPPPLPELIKKRRNTDLEKAEFLDQARGAYKKQKLYLQQNGPELFPDDRRSECLHHPGQQC